MGKKDCFKESSLRHDEMFHVPQVVAEAILLVNAAPTIGLHNFPNVAMAHDHELVLQIQSLVIIEIVFDCEISFYYLVLIILLIYNSNSFGLGQEVCLQTSAKDQMAFIA